MADVTMPKLSMNMSEGLVVEWLVDDGTAVEEGQDVVEIESEKATAVVDAPAAGVLRHAVTAGESVDVGGTLATIAGEGSTDADGTAAGGRPGPGDGASSSDDDRVGGDSPRVRATPSARRAARERGLSLDRVAADHGLSRVTADDVEGYAEVDQTVPERDSGDGEVRASPAARRAARESGVSVPDIDGSGPGGAVVLADVERARAAVPPSAPGAEIEDADRPPIRDRTELSGTRAVIAERMSESWRSAPHVTVERDVDVGRLVETRRDLDEQLDVEVSLNDLFIAAAARTLDRHPDFNATFEEDEHVRYDRVDVALAVDTERGLVAPVLRGVDEMGFADLVRSRVDLVERTLDGALDPDRLSGGTFTVSNLGPLGVRSFTPLINPPQVAILGLSTIRREPVETGDGDVEFTDVMTVSLSFDHRVVDGADAARFLQTFDDFLSNPLSVI